MDDEIWTCKDGRSIKVGDMTEEHLRNTLRMILRGRRKHFEIKRHLEAIAIRLDSFDEDDKKWGSS